MRILLYAMQAAGRKKNCLVKQWTYRFRCAILNLDYTIESMLRKLSIVMN